MGGELTASPRARRPTRTVRTEPPSARTWGRTPTSCSRARATTVTLSRTCRSRARSHAARRSCLERTVVSTVSGSSSSMRRPEAAPSVGRAVRRDLACAVASVQRARRPVRRGARTGRDPHDPFRPRRRPPRAPVRGVYAERHCPRAARRAAARREQRTVVPVETAAVVIPRGVDADRLIGDRSSLSTWASATLPEAASSPPRAIATARCIGRIVRARPLAGCSFPAALATRTWHASRGGAGEAHAAVDGDIASPVASTGRGRARRLGNVARQCREAVQQSASASCRSRMPRSRLRVARSGPPRQLIASMSVSGVTANDMRRRALPGRRRGRSPRAGRDRIVRHACKQFRALASPARYGAADPESRGADGAR